MDKDNIYNSYMYFTKQNIRVEQYLYTITTYTMSISADFDLKAHMVSQDAARNCRITSQILSLFSDSRLKGKIAIPTLDLNTIQIIFVLFKESIKVTFGQSYPQVPPSFKREKSLFQSILTQSNALDTWTPETQLSDVVSDIYQNLKNWAQSKSKLQKNTSIFQNGEQYRRKNSKESSQQAIKRKVMMNGCADNQLTQTKNLNRHFRSKLREVYFDVVKDGFEAPEDAKWIQSSFTLPRVGFQDIAKVLKNEWFNLQVNKQMQNGRFMHKIMKGMMSIKSKKLMVKYYHVMLAAAKDPQNFVKWKYQ